VTTEQVQHSTPEGPKTVRQLGQEQCIKSPQEQRGNRGTSPARHGASRARATPPFHCTMDFLRVDRRGVK
jgi:hypothetical protein